MGPNTPNIAVAPGALSASSSGAEVARELNRRAARSPLYGDTRQALPEGRNISWRIAPAPYRLPAGVHDQLLALGDHLLAFYQALNKLYGESVKGRQPAWVAAYLDQGKPEALVNFQRMNRFKKLTPQVIRPDVIVTEEGRLVACELDSVPGGIGMTGSMARDYAEFGFSPVGGADGLITGFAEMIKDAAGQDDPLLAIVVSEESNDYWHEQRWLGAALEGLGLRNRVVRPGEVLFSEDGLFLEGAAGRERIDVVYRFFELFDLQNIPKSELVQYAAKKAHVVVTPPYKAYMEEKLAFALFHHPLLAEYWLAELGEPRFAALTSLFPRTWVLDPAALPPQALIPGLTVAGRPVNDFMALAATNKKERAFVVKPSGFSPAAWGSHGVAFGHDLAQEEWEAVLARALASFPETPHILQEFHKPGKTETSFYDFGKQEVVSMEGRARLCPYYYVVGGQARLSGVLATICPLDKLAIHGMTDAVMAPAMA